MEQRDENVLTVTLLFVSNFSLSPLLLPLFLLQLLLRFHSVR